MADVETKLADIRERIAKERKILDAFQNMKMATSNSDVHKSCDAKIKETTKTIGYFEESLRELSARRTSYGTGSSMSASTSSLSTRTDSFGGARALPLPPADAGPSAYRRGDSAAALPSIPAPRQVYQNLDLIKADTPLTPAKISRMLHQLDFKLTIERQYKEGIDKMTKLYQADGDRKSRQEAESKRIESAQKMQLLNQAMKRYKALDIMGDVDDEDPGEDVKPNLRRPLSGALNISVLQARDLNRPPFANKRGKSKPESVVVVKVEDTPRARTHPSRNDRWNEDFEIHVEKANEVEVTIYDKAAGEVPIPIGMLWIRLSDVVEALRRKKAGNESGPGWVTAGRVSSANAAAGGSSTGTLDVPMGQQMPPPQSAQPGFPAIVANNEGIEAWFAVEPEGAIQLNLNFLKSNVRKRPYDGQGLGRQGAMRKRKEEVHEQNGHKFVLKQFYTVILCAFCRQFLYNAAGMQCEDCKFVCHKKCYPSVVTKCISKTNAESDKDEGKINHRIPHRFEPMSSFAPSWCCHCGMILPLSRKKARKCSECDLTAHTECVHLVPDFCGMSMERAGTLLEQVKYINASKSRLSTVPAPGPSPSLADRPSYAPAPQANADGPLADALGRTRMDDRKPVPSAAQQMQQQQRPPPLFPSSGSANGQAVYGDRTSSVPTPPSPGRERPPPSQAAYRPPPPQGPAGGRPLPAPDMYGQMPSYPSGPRPPPPGAAPARPELFPQSQPPYPGQSPYAPPPRQQQQYGAPPPQGGPPSRTSMPQYGAAPPHQQGYPSYQPAPPAHMQHQQPMPVERKRRKVGLDDFNFLAVLGKGNFGKVMLAEEKRSSKLYAIKVLKKDFIIENDEVESTKSEKRVFLAAAREKHPFLLGLHSCFQTETRVYFVMEYVSGGDLMLHIQREQFTPRRAKFYAAEVCLALAYFHENGIIYRDLKLDNIMLTLDGHVKVGDYGLCKEDMWYGKTTSTFCGTPEFMAPEILLEQRYGRAVDWWAFGVLIYEMLLGQSPFRGDDEDEIFDAILEDEPLYPIHMPRDSVSILQKLLTRDPARRLGGGQEDAEEIKRHAFFKDVNWDDMLHKRVPPPFYPSISSATDTSNFDSEFTGEQPTLTPVHSQLSAADQQEFVAFSWNE